MLTLSNVDLDLRDSYYYLTNPRNATTTIFSLFCLALSAYHRSLRLRVTTCVDHWLLNTKSNKSTPCQLHGPRYCHHFKETREEIDN
ncbi:hypothetical protein K2173_010381 [Erythroxylum novogranatense]|uniref:Uncharacterized protein n=1 Tax=Erythroxylum novogranatense TaxID=1862640 RepID=A0AAV8TDN5_9ROSI|nr:hypothetical protein K2173_010381 [Erythroxylum novogranatense]